jgi:hypothetical protein
VVGGNLLKVVAWYDNEWGYSNRLVELTADTGRMLHGDNVIEEAMTNQSEPAAPAADSSSQVGPDHELRGPLPEDSLPPAPEPIGEEVNQPVHNAEDDSQTVEGEPGLETPADTLPQQENTPPIFPPTAGPQQPHEF